MKHQPVVIELKVIEHLEALPYRVALDRFVSHTHECEPCAEAFEVETDCSEFCPEGHRLVHAVEASIARQRYSAVWN
jgi:hypothetical protein